MQTIANISILTVGKAVYTLRNLLCHFQINPFAGSPGDLQNFVKLYRSRFFKNWAWPSAHIGPVLLICLTWEIQSLKIPLQEKSTSSLHKMHNNVNELQGQTSHLCAFVKRDRYTIFLLHWFSTSPLVWHKEFYITVGFNHTRSSSATVVQTGTSQQLLNAVLLSLIQTLTVPRGWSLMTLASPSLF